MRKVSSVLLLLVVVAVAGHVQADDKDPVPLPEEPGSCTYCTKAQCGCAAPPTGFYLSYTCSCGTHSCTRDCEYIRL
jgi:hypothetical protein